MKILLVEDDETLVSVLTKSLSAHRYVVDAVKDGEMGWTYGSTFEYDLIVLDIMLPSLDGISLCQRFRAEGYTTPILLLTAQDSSTAKVQGLDAGADDYVVKPFDQAELIARIRALLRRGSINPLPLLAWGDLLLNTSTCEVTYKNSPLTLTTKEYKLLELLLRDNQSTFSTEEILDRLWSSEEFPSEATVRSHIRRLRHKLNLAGAPPDFITTVHGRGYYLKSIAAEDSTVAAVMPRRSDGYLLDDREVPPTNQVQSAAADSLSEKPHQRSLNSQQQYLAFLNKTWITTKPKTLNQLAVLFQTIKDLQAEQLNSQQRLQAQQIAHKLAGNLGMFGLTQAMHLARQLEHWLGSRDPLQPKHALLMEPLLVRLEQEIQNAVSIQSSQIPSQSSPLLLIIDAAVEFTQPLVKVAESRGLRTAISPTVAAADAWFTSDSAPDAILLRLSAVPDSKSCPDVDPHPTDALSLLQAYAPRYPILVVGDRDEASDPNGAMRERLEVVRWGGKLFLEPSVSPEQVIAAVVGVLGGSDVAAKVMVVDDDREWLRALPTLLKPWGLKVTTLADLQQFWTVLQAVTPDALVLDVNMPQINGFELCQILRNDPRWQRLPVLFLSGLTDSKSQNQAFMVGADDYLCKPVMGVDLATRIFSRLQRMRAWAS